MNAQTVTTPADEPVILIARHFDAPRLLVYRCYTDPVHLAHFWGPREARCVATIDRLAPGGVWTTTWTYPGGDTYTYASVYLDLMPGERIVYRDAPNGWRGGIEGLPPVTLHTTIALHDDCGGTRLEVTVRCNSTAERDEIVRRGFALMVGVGNDRLDEYLDTIDLASA